jgi:hypothetical protein
VRDLRKQWEVDRVNKVDRVDKVKYRKQLASPLLEGEGLLPIAIGSQLPSALAFIDCSKFARLSLPFALCPLPSAFCYLLKITL